MHLGGGPLAGFDRPVHRARVTDAVSVEAQWMRPTGARQADVISANVPGGTNIVLPPRENSSAGQIFSR